MKASHVAGVFLRGIFKGERLKTKPSRGAEALGKGLLLKNPLVSERRPVKNATPPISTYRPPLAFDHVCSQKSPCQSKCAGNRSEEFKVKCRSTKTL